MVTTMLILTVGAGQFTENFDPRLALFRSRETAGQVATFVSARGNTESFFILFL